MSKEVLLRNQVFCNQCNTFLESNNNNSNIKIKCQCNYYNSGGLDYIDRTDNPNLIKQDILLYLRNPSNIITQKIIKSFY